MTELLEKSALITGAANGIGRETALLFAEYGVAELWLLDRDPEALELVASEAAESGARVRTFTADLLDRDGVRAELREALRDGEKLDVLVNNAGIADENTPDDEATWLRVLDVNLNGTFAVTASCLPHLANGGRIVNVSSVLGKGGTVRNTAYSASKHAILGYTKSLALDLAPRGITVNAVLPGWVDTPMLRRELERQAHEIGLEPERMLRNARKSVPLRRLVKPREAAALIAFLASGEASGITAQGITVDGGYTRGM